MNNSVHSYSALLKRIPLQVLPIINFNKKFLSKLYGKYPKIFNTLFHTFLPKPYPVSDTEVKVAFEVRVTASVTMRSN